MIALHYQAIWIVGGFGLMRRRTHWRLKLLSQLRLKREDVILSEMSAVQSSPPESQAFSSPVSNGTQSRFSVA